MRASCYDGMLVSASRALVQPPRVLVRPIIEGVLLRQTARPRDHRGRPATTEGSSGRPECSSAWSMRSFCYDGALGSPAQALALSLTGAEQLATQMAEHQEPRTYLPRLPKSLPESSPLARLARSLAANPVGDSSALHLHTRGGMPLQVIAKNRKWGRDFWNDLVGPTLHADLDCETWIRGPVAPHRDNDEIHTVEGVRMVDLKPLGMPYAWPETRDHAKWAITTKRDWVCVGDINRMISQEKRGGGTVAFQDKALWRALSRIQSVK